VSSCKPPACSPRCSGGHFKPPRSAVGTPIARSRVFHGIRWGKQHSLLRTSFRDRARDSPVFLAVPLPQRPLGAWKSPRSFNATLFLSSLRECPRATCRSRESRPRRPAPRRIACPLRPSFPNQIFLRLIERTYGL